MKYTLTFLAIIAANLFFSQNISGIRLNISSLVPGKAGQILVTDSTNNARWVYPEELYELNTANINNGRSLEFVAENEDINIIVTSEEKVIVKCNGQHYDNKANKSCDNWLHIDFLRLILFLIGCYILKMIFISRYPQKTV